MGGAMQEPAFELGFQPSPRILLVENEPSAMMALEFVVNRVHFSPLIAKAGTALEAESAMHRLGPRFDLVVCDIGLESVNAGLDLWSRHYRSWKAGGETLIPFLFISSMDPEAFQRICREAVGGTDVTPYFLQKPFDFEFAAMTVREILSFTNP